MILVSRLSDTKASLLHKYIFCTCAGLLMLPTSGFGQTGMVLNDQGYVGIGLDSPARQLHLKGSNATFRMDRDANTASFILVRTDAAGTPIKTFVVGADAYGPNNGEFVINDLGTEVGGPGTRRMTINNAGAVLFTGTAYAPAFVETSSVRYKNDVKTIIDASQSVEKLRGVRFTWKETGRKSLGLIAEEVAEVFPEVVERDAVSGQVEAVNYSALTAVLIEAIKEQQHRLDAQELELRAYRTTAAKNQAQVAELKARLSKVEEFQTRLSAMEGLLTPVANLAATK